MQIIDYISAADAPAKWFTDHYYTYWARRGCVKVFLSPEEVARRREMIISWVHEAVAMFEKQGIPLPDQLRVVLFHGCGTSNGHAFLAEDGAPVVWLAIESYATEKQVRVFVTHELLHGVHYALEPALAFSTPEERLHLGRQLITEGLVTYATAKVLRISAQDALWADYVSAEAAAAWMEECGLRLPELFAYGFRHWEDAHPEGAFFYANDPSDIFKYRAGYYVGYKLWQDRAQRHGKELPSMFRLSRALVEKETKEALSRYASDTR